MKKRVYILFLICISCLLISCSRGHISSKNRIIRDYIKNEELFSQCAAEIEEYYSSRFDGSFAIATEQNGLVAKTLKEVEAEWSMLGEVEASRLQELFRATKVNLIYGRNQCIYFREFAFGMGSTTYAGICYIKSGNIQDLLEYRIEMHFEAYEEGYLGTMPGSDNYLYYQELTPHFFFYEYGD